MIIPFPSFFWGLIILLYKFSIYIRWPYSRFKWRRQKYLINRNETWEPNSICFGHKICCLPNPCGIKFSRLWAFNPIDLNVLVVDEQCYALNFVQLFGRHTRCTRLLMLLGNFKIYNNLPNLPRVLFLLALIKTIVVLSRILFWKGYTYHYCST